MQRNKHCKKHTQLRDLDKNKGKKVIETKRLKSDTQYGMICTKAILLIMFDKNMPLIQDTDLPLGEGR